MAKLAKSKRGYEIVKKGRRGFGQSVSIEFDKTLTVTASAKDCMELVGTALRDWFAEAHRTGQRFDSGLLPRDNHLWVAYETGELSKHWRMTVSGNDARANMNVWLSPPDQGRRLRLASLSKAGIQLSGLEGKALDVYQRAFATYMADTLEVS